MATTTNYGWTTPDDTALVKDGASAIRTLGSSVDTTTKALNPETTLGDIAYRSSSANVQTRLGIGTTGQVLSVSGGVPAWTTPSSGTPAFVGCSLTKSANQSIANNTATAITFDGEAFDTDGFHNNATNNSRITIPSGKAGKYLITGNLKFTSSTGGNRRADINKNGTIIDLCFLIYPNTGSDWTGSSFAFIGNFAVADYIELFGQQSSGGALNVVGDVDYGTKIQVQYLGA